MKKFICVLVALGGAAVLVVNAFAAVGCTLNDPDRDVKRIFPESTGHKTLFITIKEKGGEPLKREIEARLRDVLEPVYESMDVPYAYYVVLQGRETVGYVHGVNQKGKYGGLQLILATDLDGRIIDFYYQKISSPEASRFKDPAFTAQFKGLTLEDFMDAQGLSAIRDPSLKSGEDFRATLRGLKKNLLLTEVLLLEKGGTP